ncbi:hypothetical protein [Adhaeribacter rhizoryzae]|uniref:Uncharacterized protein n=1 Tax=Adhaeribacter rhizoryzae TaxID=2607907 RepID=A0A5M6DB52_9BACT|nr:hypothetical protein [Adhaeribacter rhizoryzae]KAA5543542.1 hypothetical protein F0145_16630 [Adhaeribacter rhizoryzae]
MRYQLGGYFAMQLNRPANAPHPYFTVCTNFNDSLLDYWAWQPMAWLKHEEDLTKIKEKFALSDQRLEAIRTWVAAKETEGKLSFGKIFSDLKTAKAYRAQFFNHLPNTCILSLSFLKEDVQETLQMIKINGMGHAGHLWENLTRHLKPDPEEPGEVIGYDVIGVELGVETLDSFLVHGKNLFEPLGVQVNQYGLVPDETKEKEIINFMNNPDNPVAPELWYWAQVKLYS